MAVARLAALAEESGWDGLFVWDQVRWRDPVEAVADPWITLAAVAAATERIRLGPMVTPLARRRAAKVARETATLDRLSGGRRRDASVPLDTIERAVKRGTGQLEGVVYEQITYEGYAPHGVAMLIEVLTDNRNRTGPELKTMFSRAGGSMAEPGAVAWQFERKGTVLVDRAADEDELMMAALDAGAEDIAAPPPRMDAIAADGALDTVRPATGLVLDPYFSASKVEWLLTEGGVEAGPNLCVGTIDAWLLWNLTGGNVFATEPSNASRTMLYDIRSLGWSDELCDLFGVPRSALPEVLPSSGRFGKTVGDTGLPAGIPISGIAGDQQAALFGQACFTPGMTKNTYGTGSFVLMNVGPECPEPVEGLLTTVAWTLAGGETAYAYEGAIL